MLRRNRQNRRRLMFNFWTPEQKHILEGLVREKQVPLEIVEKSYGYPVFRMFKKDKVETESLNKSILLFFSGMCFIIGLVSVIVMWGNEFVPKTGKGIPSR